MRRLNRFLFLMLLLPLSAAHAQQNNYEEERNMITEVKRAPDVYIYAEATCKTVEEAEAVVEEMFLENINACVAQMKAENGGDCDFIVNDNKKLRQEITMPRGSNMHRVFMYVKRSDIIAVKNSIVIIDNAATSEADNKAKVVVEDVPEVAAAPKVETAPEVAPQPVVTATQEIPAVIKEIAACKSVTELGAKLRQLKANGSIAAYDKYNNIADRSGWYLMLYDKTGAIKAALTDVRGDSRYNVTTLDADSEKNYPRHAAIGVRIK